MYILMAHICLLKIGITNFVTSVAAAYWAHSPVVAITPEAATLTKGLGGFQEADQLPMFETITKYQGHVNNPNRIAEITARTFDIAMNERGPTQLNIPRDFFYHEGNTHAYLFDEGEVIHIPCHTHASMDNRLSFRQES